MSEEKKVVEEKKEETPEPKTDPNLQTVLQSRDEHFQARLRAEAEVKQLREMVEDKKEEKAPEPVPDKESSDSDAIVKSWEDKYSKLEAQLKARDEKIVQNKVEGLVNEMAAKIDSDVPELFKSMFDRRIKGEVTESGGTKITCLDKKGQPSALTPDEIVKEVLDDERYKKYIVSNRSSGSGKGEEMNTSLNYQLPTTSSSKEVDLSKASSVDLVAHIQRMRRI